jgi:hypothetical protein
MSARVVDSRPNNRGTARAQRRVPSRSARAYTAVEVMLAMTVLLITSMGVMSMQKAAIQGNLDARKLDVANSIARIWLDRLATDTATWNQNTIGLIQTTWLGTAAGNGGLFAAPALVGNAASAQSPAFDILGRDLTNVINDPTTEFCAHIQVVPVANNAAGIPVLLRATVLVYWAKQLASTPPSSPLCAETDVAKKEAGSPGTYHMIFATEALWSP